MDRGGAGRPAGDRGAASSKDEVRLMLGLLGPVDAGDWCEGGVYGMLCWKESENSGNEKCEIPGIARATPRWTLDDSNKRTGQCKLRKISQYTVVNKKGQSCVTALLAEAIV